MVNNAENTSDNGPTRETIVLPEGNNNFSISGRSAVIYSGAGDDTISMGSGDYEVFADSGNNTISVNSGNATVYTGAGDDRFNVTGTGSVTFYAGDGNNQLDSSAVYDVAFYSGADRDVVTGSVSLGRFFIDAGGGDNEIRASGLSRGTTTEVRTGSGKDTIFAQSTFNTIKAGDGDNVITSYASRGTQIQTGTGSDRIELRVSGDATERGTASVNAGDGNNQLSSLAYATSEILLGRGDDTVNLELSGGKSKIYADAGNNRITVTARVMFQICC
jgi:Ca2+-binding RTX toxin-like protein